MEHIDKVNAIKHIRPNAEFVLRGDELDWLDEEKTKPTQKEIEAGLIAFEKAKEKELIQKAEQRQAILDRLGLTADEAKLLLG